MLAISYLKKLCEMEKHIFTHARQRKAQHFWLLREREREVGREGKKERERVREVGRERERKREIYSWYFKKSIA